MNKKMSFGVIGLLALQLLGLFAMPKVSAEEFGFSGLPIHGFADAGYGMDTSTDKHRGYARGFYLNNVDLYFDPDFHSNVRFVAEISFEPDQASGSPGVDTERLMAGYVFSNYLSAWVGRFHTPVGYWTMAYHHGNELQTTVDRPRFLDFEDHTGVIPVHTVGLWLRGDTFIGEHRLGYMAWFGNGDRLVADSGGHFANLDFNAVNDDNRDMTYGARLIWFFGGSLSGLQVGTSAMTQRVDAYGADGNSTTPNIYTGTTFSSRLNMYSAHAVYEARGLEFLNEFYLFNNSVADSLDKNTYKSYAGYSQLGYSLNGTLTPYIRWERGNFSVSDPFFKGQTNGVPYSKEMLGMRLNVSDNAAVKFEVAHIGFNGSNADVSGNGYNIFKTNYSISF